MRCHTRLMGYFCQRCASKGLSLLKQPQSNTLFIASVCLLLTMQVARLTKIIFRANNIIGERAPSYNNSNCIRSMWTSVIAVRL